MAEGTDNLRLKHLRGVRGDIVSLADALHETTLRLQSLESAVVSIKQDIANQYSEIVLMNLRYDNFNSRLNGAVRRLEISPT